MKTSRIVSGSSLPSDPTGYNVCIVLGLYIIAILQLLAGHLVLEYLPAVQQEQQRVKGSYGGSAITSDPSTTYLRQEICPQGGSQKVLVGAHTRDDLTRYGPIVVYSSLSGLISGNYCLSLGLLIYILQMQRDSLC